MEHNPKFEIGKSRYNLNTYLGRFYHNIEIIDPRTLFISNDKLNNSIKLLEDYKNGNLPIGFDDKLLWEAQKIKQSTIHPDTGEKILMPFRMSGYVPFNSPILAGLLMNNPTIPQLIFWQWLNQSHNACVNYANRNATKPTNMKRFVKGYSCAVTAAISLGVGLNLGIKNASFFSKTMKSMLLRFTPLPAVMTASTLNVVLMRIHELEEGIDVIDKQGNVIGNSKLAAKYALKEMAITRAVLPIPLLLFPSLAMSYIEKSSLLKKNPRLGMPINIGLCSLSFFITLPATLAIFPQLSEVKIEDLEAELQKKCSDETLFYNKGL